MTGFRICFAKRPKVANRSRSEMPDKLEKPWWGTNGDTFVVRDKTMRSNVSRSTVPGRNPSNIYFYVDTSDWSVFEGSFRNVINKRGYHFIDKFASEAGEKWTALMQANFDSVQKEFAERWNELDEKVLETAHSLHLQRHGFEIPAPSFIPAKKRSRRLARCWSCKLGLDSSVDVGCVECKWILCACGACGCGYYD